MLSDINRCNTATPCRMKPVGLAKVPTSVRRHGEHSREADPWPETANGSIRTR
jgi:hypothetical protein